MTHIHSAVLAPDGSPTDIASTSVVPWWCFTKTLIAACAVILMRRQRVTLDAPLTGLPYTLRQLLQHTAGVGPPAATRKHIYVRDPDGNKLCALYRPK